MPSWRARRSIGIPRLADLNDLDATDGAAPFPLNARGTTRWNTAFAYLDPARARPNLTIVADTLVDRVVVENGAAVGVVCDGGVLEAERIVVSAGAYASPAILLRSGIGPGEELRLHGIEPVADELPVGEGLVDHPGVGVAWTPSPDLEHAMREHDVDGFFEPQILVRLRSSSCPDGTWDAHLLPWVTRSPERGRYESSCVAYALKPHSRGRVGLRSRDPSADRRSTTASCATGETPTSSATRVEALRAIVANEPVAHLVTAEERPGDEDFDAHLRANVRGIFHPVATCALGPVVDADGAVHGLEGLFVVDASVIPTIPRANTNLSTVAVAELLAERLAAR